MGGSRELEKAIGLGVMKRLMAQDKKKAKIRRKKRGQEGVKTEDLAHCSRLRPKDRGLD